MGEGPGAAWENPPFGGTIPILAHSCLTRGGEALADVNQ
jgi:hypothetical protein